jgi:hypothetical protein
VRLDGLGQLKKSTSTGLEPATLRNSHPRVWVANERPFHFPQGNACAAVEKIAVVFLMTHLMCSYSRRRNVYIHRHSHSMDELLHNKKVILPAVHGLPRRTYMQKYKQ